MIAVSLHPQRVWLGVVSELVVRLTNTGPATCTNIRLVFHLPRDMLLVQGRTQVDIARLGGGQSHDHAIRVKAKAIGCCQVVSHNLSYRDPAGWPQRIEEVRMSLEVVPAPAPGVPRLALSLQTAQLPAGTWQPVQVRVANVGDDRALDIRLSVSGPGLQCQSHRVESLDPGQAVVSTPRVRGDPALSIGSQQVGLTAAFRDPQGRLHQGQGTAELQIDAPPREEGGAHIHIEHAQIEELSQGKTQIGDVGMIKGAEFGGGGPGAGDVRMGSVGLLRTGAPGEGEPPAPLRPEEGLRNCSQCGRIVGPEDRFCSDCGARL